MGLTSLGELTLAVALPGAAAACLAGQAGIGLALPDIQGRIAAMASFSPNPGSLADLIVLANQIIAMIEAAIAQGIVAPSLSVQIQIIAGIVAELEAIVVSIAAQLAIVTALLDVLAVGGLKAWVYDGAENGLGPALTTALPNPTACHALIFVAEADATWTACSAVFKVS
jgi:hypothetical protein